MNVIPEAQLSQYTTFQLGGPCEYLVDCQTPDQLKEALEKLSKFNRPFVLIGGGSNIVASDQGLDYGVVRYYSPTPIIQKYDNEIVVAASTILDDVAKYCVQEALEGFNFVSGIPGTVGGAIVGNAGAWGKQVGDCLVSAVLIDKNGKTKEVGNKYFEFTYRNSKLKETNEIVLSARFMLHPGDSMNLAKERLEIIKKRTEKHPNLKTQPCAGSFFRNVEATSAAARRQAAGSYLEDAGAMAFKVGGALVFEKHANIIVKGPDCKAQDVYDLHLLMMDAVKKKFNLQLIREVRFLGPFKDIPTPGFH